MKVGRAFHFRDTSTPRSLTSIRDVHNGEGLEPKLMRVGRRVNCARLTRGSNGYNPHAALSEAFRMLEVPTQARVARGIHSCSTSADGCFAGV